MTKTRSTGKIVSMKIHFSNQDMLRNFGNFLNQLIYQLLTSWNHHKNQSGSPCTRQLYLQLCSRWALRRQPTITDEVSPQAVIDRMGLYEFRHPVAVDHYPSRRNRRFILISIIKTLSRPIPFYRRHHSTAHLPRKLRVIKYVIASLFVTSSNIHVQNGAYCRCTILQKK